MRISNATPRYFYTLAAATLLSASLVSYSARAAEADTTNNETYEWSANLVAFDASDRTAVMRARVATHSPIEGLDDFNEGDRLTLVWSGRFWASGVRSLTREPDLEAGTLALPVEFVASEGDGQYIEFRVPVPEQSIERISEIEPGMWVTATSPKSVTDWRLGVTSLRHYNDVD